MADLAIWTDEDTEAMFATIGRYLIIFQWAESKLDQILLLGWGHENLSASQTKLAKMTNAEKIRAVKHIVLESEDFSRVHTRPEWCADFQLLVGRLQDEGDRRNSVVHSQYLFEFTEIGQPPLQSRRKKVDGKAVFVQKHLGTEAQEKMLKQITQLSLDVSFLHLQLVHDYQALTDGTSTAEPTA